MPLPYDIVLLARASCHKLDRSLSLSVNYTWTGAAVDCPEDTANIASTDGIIGNRSHYPRIPFHHTEFGLSMHLEARVLSQHRARTEINSTHREANSARIFSTRIDGRVSMVDSVFGPMVSREPAFGNLRIDNVQAGTWDHENWKSDLGDEFNSTGAAGTRRGKRPGRTAIRWTVKGHQPRKRRVNLP